MKVPLTQGKVAHIDPEDWPFVAPHRWYAAKTQAGHWYAHAAPQDGVRRKAKVKMHNLILGRKWVDHRDGDGLNNRRTNLRACTNSENQQNIAARSGSSRFKGVYRPQNRGPVASHPMLQAFCEKYLGLKCNGFVGNYVRRVKPKLPDPAAPSGHSSTP